MRSLDLPDQPDEPSRAGHDGAGRADRLAPKPRELPDPDERSRVYDATQAHVSAETGEWAEQDRRPDAGEQGGYWAQVSRFRDMWADHESRWPEPQTAAEADRPADATGLHRSKSSFELSSEQRGEIVEAIRRMREAEPSISADMLTIEKENTNGGGLAGFEFRRKGGDRLEEKIAEQMKAESDEPAADVLRRIPDALRYTYCFEPDNYTKGYYSIKTRLEGVGHEMFQSTNYWSDPEYKGINTRWVTPQGQRFEVQFHTPESFHAKHQVTHLAYERIRDTTTSRAEFRELHAFQREVSAWIQIPDGAADIPDFKKEGF